MDIEKIQAKLGHGERLIITIDKSDCFMELIGRGNKTEVNDVCSNNTTFNESIDYIFS